LTTVWTTTDALAARRAVAELEEAGIAAQVAGGALPFGGVLESYAVVVDALDAERARGILGAQGDRVPPAPATAHPAGIASPSDGEPAPGLELLLLLWLGWLVPLFSALSSLRAPSVTVTVSNFDSVRHSIQDLGFLLLFWVLARTRAGASTEYGLARPTVADLGPALLLLVVGLGASELLFLVLHASDALAWLDGLYAAAPPLPWIVFDFGSTGAGPMLAGAATLLHLVPLAAVEECAYRGYLLPELTKRLRSPLLATLVSTTLFASTHLYQGAPGVANAFLFGLLASLLFFSVRRLWPLVLGHALYNWWLSVGLF
jgi:membrane protease YdiL (CAAX protease family)